MGKSIAIVVKTSAVNVKRQEKQEDEVPEEVTDSGRGFDEALLTPKQVAALFGVDPKTVTRWAQAGKIGCVITPGGHRRYRSAEVHAFLRPRNSSQ